MADTDITLTVGLDTDDVESASKKIESALDKAFNSSSSKVQKLGTRLQETVKEINSLSEELEEIGNQKIPTDEFKQLETDIGSAEKALEGLRTEMANMIKSGDAFSNTPTKEYQKLVEEQHKALDDVRAASTKEEVEEAKKRYAEVTKQLEELKAKGEAYEQTDEFKQKAREAGELANKLENLKTKQQELNSTGKGYISGADTEAYKEKASQLKSAKSLAASLASQINALEEVGKKASATSDKIAGLGRKWLGMIGKVKQALPSLRKKHDSAFKSMIGNLVKYAFRITTILMMLRKLFNTFKEGIIEMAKDFPEILSQVDSLKNSWSGFKASIVSAFQPIFSYVVPALVTLINYLTTAMNALANFFALLTGQGHYYKAKKGNESVAGAIDKTGGAAKKANKQLAEYDDLIVIQQDKDSSGADGGAGGSSEAWNWEKVDVTDNPLVDKLRDIWDVFKQAWDAKGKDVVEAAKYAFESLKALAIDIADTFYRVFTDGYGFDWLVSCLGVLEKILLIIGDIATEFKKAWDKDNNGYNLLTSFFEMLTAINNMCIQIGISFRNAWNSGLGEKIIENILHTITNIQLTVKALADNFTKAWTEAGRGDLIFKHLLEIVQQITQFFEDITNSLKEWAEDLDFAPLLDGFDSFIKGVKKLLEPVLDLIKTLWNEYVLPFAKNFIEKYAPKILTILGKVIGNLSPIIDAVKNLAHAFEPVLNKITDNFWDGLLIGADAVADAIGVIAEVIAGILNFVAEIETFIQGNPVLTAIQAMLNPLESVAGVVDFIKVGFDGWGDVFKNIKTSFTAMWNGIVGGVETLKKYFDVGFKYILNLILDKVKAIWDGIKNILAGWKAYFENLWNIIVNIFKGVGEWFKQRFTEAWNNIKTAFSQVGTWFKARWNDIVNVFKVAGTWFKTTFTNAWNNIKSAFAQVGSFFTSVWSTIKSKFSSAASWFRTTFQNAWNAVQNVFHNWGSFFGNLWNTIKDKFTSIGTNIAEAISSSVKSGINYVIGRIESTVNSGVRIINSAIRLANKLPGVSVGTINTVSLPRLARGGIIDKEMLAQIGEDGTEAVVPLEKNLGWLDKIATMISDKLADVQSPLAQGNILPVSQAFMNTTSQLMDNSKIAELLEDILYRLSNLENTNPTTNHEPIMLQLDGRTVAQVVWDESEKKYKQTGIRYAY